MRKSILLLALLLTATSGFSATCAELQKMKAVAYGFSPAKLSAEERKLKSKFLDEFWRAVENSRPDGATCLQSMLVAESQDKFFLYDGASLLYGLDESADSARVVVRALSATDLQDIDPVEFVNFTIRLAREGHDVLPLARKFLYEATGEVNVPQHALRLDHESVSMLLFGLMPPEQTEQVLVEALQDKRG